MSCCTGPCVRAQRLGQAGIMGCGRRVGYRGCADLGRRQSARAVAADWVSDLRRAAQAQHRKSMISVEEPDAALRHSTALRRSTPTTPDERFLTSSRRAMRRHPTRLGPGLGSRPRRAVGTARPEIRARGRDFGCCARSSRSGGPCVCHAHTAQRLARLAARRSRRPVPSS